MFAKNKEKIDFEIWCHEVWHSFFITGEEEEGFYGTKNQKIETGWKQKRQKNWCFFIGGALIFSSN